MLSDTAQLATGNSALLWLWRRIHSVNLLDRFSTQDVDVVVDISTLMSTEKSPLAVLNPANEVLQDEQINMC